MMQRCNIVVNPLIKFVSLQGFELTGALMSHRPTSESQPRVADVKREFQRSSPPSTIHNSIAPPEIPLIKPERDRATGPLSQEVLSRIEENRQLALALKSMRRGEAAAVATDPSTFNNMSHTGMPPPRMMPSQQHTNYQHYEHQRSHLNQQQQQHTPLQLQHSTMSPPGAQMPAPLRTHAQVVVQAGARVREQGQDVLDSFVKPPPYASTAHASTAHASTADAVCAPARSVAYPQTSGEKPPAPTAAALHHATSRGTDTSSFAHTETGCGTDSCTSA